MSHWNIAGRPKSGPLAELKCRAAFRHDMKFLRENEDQLRFDSQCYQNFKGDNVMISGWILKHSILRKNPCHKQFDELLGNAIFQTYGKIISVQLQILLTPVTTEIRS